MDIDVIITIPEQIREDLINGCFGAKIEDMPILIGAFMDGVVLKEDHGRIIDANEFADNVVKYSHQSLKTIGKALSETETLLKAKEKS